MPSGGSALGGFAHRGLVEGFYGPPWRHEDRCWLLSRMGCAGMNRYVHAPKDDALHRAEWRTPYPADRLREFALLVEHGARAGVDVGFAISPGLSIEYGNARDVRDLIAKLGALRELGGGLLCLALDDVPSELVHAADRAAFPSLAAAHVALAHAVHDELGGDAPLWLVPTDYLGADPTPYLEEMGETLRSDIEVGWTGRTVMAPSIEVDEARRRAATLRRRLLVWDNVPVQDGPMRPMLHLGPYMGRDPGLALHVSGVLLNPMLHAHASWLTIRCAADFLCDPTAYDPEHSWRAAARELGTGAEDAFELFARAHRFWCGSPLDRDRELEDRIEAVRRAGAGELGPVATELRTALEARLAANAALEEGLADRDLLREIAPWIASHRAETGRMLGAAELLCALASSGPGMDRVRALLRFEGALSHGALAPHASYGPRRVLYAQLVSMTDRGARFGRDRALFTDCSLSDELVAWAESHALDLLGNACDEASSAPD